MMKNIVKYKSEIFEEKTWKVENERKILSLLVSLQEILGDLIDYGTCSMPSEKLLYLLEHMRHETIAQKISVQLKKMGIHEKILVYYLGQILCKYKDSKKLQDNIKRMSKLPGIKELYGVKNGYTFITDHGTVTIYRANQILSNTKLLKTYHQMKLDNSFYLHTLLAPLFPNDTIVSCFMPNLFEGFFYESYMKLEKAKGTVDLIHNTFYKDDSFETFFEPQILVKEKGQNLDYDIPPLLVKTYEYRNSMIKK